jgi:hypothetical protein
MIRDTRTLFLAVIALFLTGCGGIELRLAKGAVEAGKPVQIFAKLAAPAGTKVNFKIISGEECGTLSNKDATTSDIGVALVAFNATADVEDCAVRIRADSDPVGNATLAFFVNKQPLTKARIDGVSLLVFFLIASFLVDRLVRGLMLGLSFFAFWKRLAPAKSEKRQQVAYVALAGGLAVILLSWVGNIHILAALGFAQVHSILDTLFTGLLLVAGADRTEALLNAMGAGQNSEGGVPHSAGPVEIKGEIVLVDRQPK